MFLMKLRYTHMYAQRGCRKASPFEPLARKSKIRKRKMGPHQTIRVIIWREGTEER